MIHTGSLGWFNFNYNYFLEKISDVKELNQILSKTIDETAERFNEEISSKADKLSDAIKDEYLELHSNDLWKYDFNFRAIINESLFIHIYSKFESFLTTAADEIKEIYNIPLNISDLSGKFLEQFKNYLNLVGITNIFSTAEWGEILFYRSIRNRFVHHEGYIDYKYESGQKKPSKLSKKIEQTKFIELHNDFLILLEDEFCENCIITIANFSSNLVNEMNNGYKNRSRDNLQ